MNPSTDSPIQILEETHNCMAVPNAVGNSPLNSDYTINMLR